MRTPNARREPNTQSSLATLAFSLKAYDAASESIFLPWCQSGDRHWLERGHEEPGLYPRSPANDGTDLAEWCWSEYLRYINPFSFSTCSPLISVGIWSARRPSLQYRCRRCLPQPYKVELENPNTIQARSCWSLSIFSASHKGSAFSERLGMVFY